MSHLLLRYLMSQMYHLKLMNYLNQMYLMSLKRLMFRLNQMKR